MTRLFRYEKPSSKPYPYEYFVSWAGESHYGFDSEDVATRELVHEIVTPDGAVYIINFDPYSWMTMRDFVRLVDYFEAKGDWPVHIIPDEPIKNGEPSYFCAIGGVA